MDEEGKIMRTISLEELLEAGCHFGHQVTRQNAKAREFIFEARDGIHIIDLEKLKDITARLKDETEKAKYTKKEIGDWDKARVKLEGFYGGTQDLLKTPDAIFVVDSHMEDVAVKEALKMGVPTVGLTDTNSDPS